MFEGEQTVKWCGAIRPGMKVWRLKGFRPSEEGATYEVLAVAGTPSVFDQLKRGPAPGYALCLFPFTLRGRRSNRVGEVVEIPITDLYPAFTWPLQSAE